MYLLQGAVQALTVHCHTYVSSGVTRVVEEAGEDDGEETAGGGRTLLSLARLS